MSEPSVWLIEEWQMGNGIWVPYHHFGQPKENAEFDAEMLNKRRHGMYRATEYKRVESGEKPNV